MLTGDMARFTGDEKYHRSSDFFGCGHSLSQWNPCDDRFQLLFRIGERAQPLLIERRHNFDGNSIIHSGIVDQGIDSTKLLNSLLNSGETSLSSIQLRHNQIAVAMALS